MHALMPLAALALAAALVGCEYAGGPNVPVPVPSAGVGTAGIIAAGGDVTGSGGGNIIAAGGGNVVGHNGAAAVPVLERTRAPRAPAPAASAGPTPAPGQPAPPQQPSCDSGFAQADADHDGAVTAKELGGWQQGEAWRQEVACPPATPCDAPTLGARFTTYDANADGRLDQGELCELLDAAFGAAGASPQAGPAS